MLLVGDFVIVLWLIVGVLRVVDYYLRFVFGCFGLRRVDFVFWGW